MSVSKLEKSPGTDRSASSKGSAAASWSEYRERGGYFSLRCLFVAYRLAGHRLCSLLVYPVVVYFFLFSSRSRRASRAYLECLKDCRVAIPPISPLLIYRHILQFGLVTFDKIRVWSGDLKRDELSWVNKGELLELREKGQGVVLVGAHMGGPEIGRALASRDNETSVVLNVLMFRQRVAQGLYRFLEKLDPSSSVNIVPLENVGPEIIQNLRDAIARGENVAMLADRVTAGAPEKTVEVSFLGRSAHFPAGPWILASMLECPIYLVLFLRTGYGSYEIHFEEFARQIRLERGRREVQLEAVVQRYAAELEKICRRHPLQWFNFYDFWSSNES